MGEQQTIDRPTLASVTEKISAKLNAEDNPALPNPEPTPKPSETPKAGDPDASDKGVLENGQKVENEKLDEKTLADIKAGRVIPKWRLDEESAKAKENEAKAKAYESLGSPEQIKELIEKAKNASLPPSKQDPELKLTDEDKETMNYFLNLFPEIKSMKELATKIGEVMKKVDSLETEREQEKKLSQSQLESKHNALIDKGIEKVKALAKDKNLPIATDRQVSFIVNGVTQILNENKDLAHKFYMEGDTSVLDKVFEEFYQENYSGFQVKAAADLLKDKKNQEKISQRTPSGGIPDQESKKPKTFKEAQQAIIDKL